MTRDAFAARLFVDGPLEPGAARILDEGRAHYLRHVLRQDEGARIALLDGVSGEYAGRLTGFAKKSATVDVGERLRPFARSSDVWLCFAPIRQARMDFLIEKATELGAARLVPVLTQRGQVNRVNLERLQAQVREAAEQCERLDLPPVTEPVALRELLATWPTGRVLYAALERRDAAPLSAASGPAALLVGPEGGLDQAEVRLLEAQPFVRPVSLGPMILRAETAAIAGLSLLLAGARR